MPASGMAGNYSPVERIPVDDPQTKAVTAALFMPPGAGPPAAIVLSGYATWGPMCRWSKRLLADYEQAGVAVLVLDSFAPAWHRPGMQQPQHGQTVRCACVTTPRRRAPLLAARPDIDARRIYLQGYSHGAITAIAATDAPVPAGGAAPASPAWWRSTRTATPRRACRCPR